MSQIRNGLLLSLCQDQHGAVLSIEMVLTATIVMLGSIVGLSTFRDAVVQELGDVSAGMSSLNHSYKMTDISTDSTIDNVRSSIYVAGSGYSDNLNAGEDPITDPVGKAPMCIDISIGTIANEN